jgi:hypothetical protein
MWSPALQMLKMAAEMADMPLRSRRRQGAVRQGAVRQGAVRQGR